MAFLIVMRDQEDWFNWKDGVPWLFTSFRRQFVRETQGWRTRSLWESASPMPFQALFLRLLWSYESLRKLIKCSFWYSRIEGVELVRIRLFYKFPSDTSASDSQTSLSVAKLWGIKIGKTYLRRYDYGLHIKPQNKRKLALSHAAEVGITTLQEDLQICKE